MKQGRGEASGDVAHRVVRNSLVVFLARAVEVGSALVTIPVLTRYLGPEKYGSYSWILALVFPFQTLVNFELNTILTREIARRPEGARSQVGAALWIKWPLTGFFLLAMVGIGAARGLPREVALALAIVVAGEVAYQHALLWTGVFHAHQRMEIETVLTVLARVVSVGGQILAVLLDGGLIWVCVPLAAGSALRALVGGLLVARHFVLPRLVPSLTAIRGLVREAALMTAASTLMAIAMRVSVYLLEHLRGEAEVALYNLPFQLIVQVQILPAALVIALFPVFSRWSEGERDRLTRTANLAIHLLLLTGGALTVLGTPLARPLVLLLSGAAFLEAQSSLRILLWAVPFLFLNFLLSYLLISLQEQRKLIVGAVVTILINGGLGWYMVDLWGHRGASAASVAGYATQTIIIMYYLKKALPGIDYRGFMAKPIAYCIVAYGASCWLERLGSLPALAAGASILGFGILRGGLVLPEQVDRIRGALRRRRGGEP